jgi:DNA-binding GntR family transcriptional regulator
VAQYREATLVQQEPPRDAFVAVVSQQLADKLQDCREFIKNEKVTLDHKEPTASLTNISAETVKQTSGRNEGGESSTYHDNA